MRSSSTWRSVWPVLAPCGLSEVLQVTWPSDAHISVMVRGMKASVLDLFIHGNLRIVLKPLIHNTPLVGGVQVTKELVEIYQDFSFNPSQFYFLENPNIDFAVAGLANVTDLPGISSILRYSQ